MKLYKQLFNNNLVVKGLLIFFQFSQPPPVAHIPPTSAYAPGMSVLAESQACKRPQGQGHPLKSFTVPAPPPISAPGTPQPKHVGKLKILIQTLLLVYFYLISCNQLF